MKRGASTHVPASLWRGMCVRRIVAVVSSPTGEEVSMREFMNL